jgi:hypothetical protein
MAISVFWASASAVAGPLQAGAFKVSITPTPDEFPYVVKGELPFVGVHDQIYARALVLDDGVRKLVIVSIEVTDVPYGTAITNAVAQAVGVPESSVLVAATHTHNVPLVFYHNGEPTPTQTKEMDRIKQSAVQAAQGAASHLQPASVAFGRGEAWVNVNNGGEAGLSSRNDPAGRSDKSVDVIRVQKRNGEPLALLVNYASHAGAMFYSVTKDGGYEVTGDLPGRTTQLLEESAHAAPVVLYTAAAEADQLTLFESKQYPGNLPAGDEGAAGWAILDVQARRLASAVIDTLAMMPAGSSNVSLAATTDAVSCPGEHRQMNRTSGQVVVESRPPVSIPLAVIRIGDIALAGVGGDLGTGIGQSIKAASPAPHTTVVSMIAGSIGYIMPDSSYAHLGHGVMGSPLKAGCAQQAIVGGLKPMLANKK